MKFLPLSSVHVGAAHVYVANDFPVSVFPVNPVGQLVATGTVVSGQSPTTRTESNSTALPTVVPVLLRVILRNPAVMLYRPTSSYSTLSKRLSEGATAWLIGFRGTDTKGMVTVLIDTGTLEARTEVSPAWILQFA